MSQALRWVPLESNPELMTKYSRSLGAKVGEWVDVYGFDDDILANFLDVKALMLLFPITAEYDAYCKEQDAKIFGSQEVSPDLFHMKQTIHNACGTVGIIHALANNTESTQLADDGILTEFLAGAKNLSTAEERGKFLETADKIASVHKEIAAAGQTDAPDPEQQFETHFVAFVEKNGQLYELDGRRQGPINHGTTSADNLLKDAAKVCENRIKTLDSSSEYRFSVVALSLNP